MSVKCSQLLKIVCAARARKSEEERVHLICEIDSSRLTLATTQFDTQSRRRSVSRIFFKAITINDARRLVASLQPSIALDYNPEIGDALLSVGGLFFLSQSDYYR